MVVGLLVGAAIARAGEPEAVTVREAPFGLPHFYAATDVALARENGREIAKDRLGQLILLARVGRGTLSEVFFALDASTLDDDVFARQTQYTSSELNNMFAKLRMRERNMLLAYCAGVNDTIERVYAGELPEPIEVNILRMLGFGENLFGNAANISDQVDPYYRAPAQDPEHPKAGFQFTPEMAVSIGVLEVRNFGLESFDEPSRLAELQALIAKHGDAAGTQIWDDLNFLNDPLAPVSVPDPTTPGYGGPLSLRSRTDATRLASAAAQEPRFDYAAPSERRRAAAARREEFASRWGAWPKMGSYAWAIAANRSATGHPWLGGFPQTGIQTPSIMHFAENRSGEGVMAIGMEFAGAPFVLIGHADQVAWTTTTALLRTVETFFEHITSENADALRYSDEGTPAPLSSRIEIFRGVDNGRRVMWRSHARNGNGGSRPILDFIGDTRGTASGGSPTSLEADGAFDASFTGGYIAIVAGTAAGEIRHIAAVVGDDRVEVDADAPWTVEPTASSEFVAVRPGKEIIAVATDSPVWLEETTSVLGFSLFQRAVHLLQIKAAARLMPSTHNFLAADNKRFNGSGTDSGNGNIGYWASGFSRIRSGGGDPRLPTDGSQPNPFVLLHGTVASAAQTTLTASAAVFSGQTMAALPVNYRYEHPSDQGREYIVAITGGRGYKQTRRIASNDDSSLTIEYPWAVVPAAGDSFEVYAIVGMPEAVNPAEGYLANWNNKAATADEGNNFGRLWRHLFILERLEQETAWDRAKLRQLNADLAGLDGKGDIGRFLLPRLRQAVSGVGSGGNPAVETVLSRLEAQQAPPESGRYFTDAVRDTTTAGEVAFLNQLVNKLAQDIYGDEYDGAVPVPSASRALSIVQHAIDTAAGDLPGGYQQAYGGSYFNGTDWRAALRDSFSVLATQGVPADGERPQSTYRHPLAALLPALSFEPTPQGNRGTYEQIVDVSPVLKGEFIFPLGQSGLIEGSIGGVNAIDPNFTSLQPIWRDWRFVPMLPMGRDIAAGTVDSDNDGVPDVYERWYFGNLDRDGSDDADHDHLSLREEAAQGVDPSATDTDGDRIRDGFDTNVRDRLGDSRCVGDCGGDLRVSVDELLRGVNIALGLQELGQCVAADYNRDGQVGVAELVRAVNAALSTCTI
jgi:acyl-homoserine lactone acylase PvdQ